MQVVAPGNVAYSFGVLADVVALDLKVAVLVNQLVQLVVARCALVHVKLVGAQVKLDLYSVLVNHVLLKDVSQLHCFVPLSFFCTYYSAGCANCQVNTLLSYRSGVAGAFSAPALQCAHLADRGVHELDLDLLSADLSVAPLVERNAVVVPLAELVVLVEHALERVAVIVLVERLAPDHAPVVERCAQLLADVHLECVLAVRGLADVDPFRAERANIVNIQLPVVVVSDRIDRRSALALIQLKRATRFSRSV